VLDSAGDDIKAVFGGGDFACAKVGEDSIGVDTGETR
jgi:hypothetical protein